MIHPIKKIVYCINKINVIDTFCNEDCMRHSTQNNIYYLKYKKSLFKKYKKGKTGDQWLNK